MSECVGKIVLVYKIQFLGYFAQSIIACPQIHLGKFDFPPYIILRRRATELFFETANDIIDRIMKLFGNIFNGKVFVRRIIEYIFYFICHALIFTSRQSRIDVNHKTTE